MALCPFAKLEVIEPGDNDPPITPRTAILHVAVSMVASLFSFFRWRSGGIESHFYINWRGKIIQYRDTGWQADANYEANDFAVSIETAGWALGRWNLLQRLALWLRDEVGIPLTVCAGPTSSGWGYHTQFGAPGPWTPVAKSCPGPNRIKQFYGWFVPWMSSNPTSPEEDDMPFTEQQLRAIISDEAEKAVDKVLSADMNVHDPKGEARFRGMSLRDAIKAIHRAVVKSPRG